MYNNCTGQRAISLDKVGNEGSSSGVSDLKLSPRAEEGAMPGVAEGAAKQGVIRTSTPQGPAG